MKKTDKILKEIGISRVALNEGKKYSKGFMEDGNIGEGYVAGLKVDAGT
ncbi:histidine decarboxylase, pyruvoyl type, partial [Staphylococcus epidermidis]